MNKLTLDELKKVELDILIWFANICEKENLNYTLSYGTLLGAVRHKGFIPWDDDIDVAMPRPDYERFIEYCNTHDTHYKLIDVHNNKGYNYLFAKVYDPNTKIIEKYANRFKADYGVYIDIFPVDGFGNDFDSGLKFYNQYKFKKSILAASQWRKFFVNKCYGFKRQVIRFIFYILSRFTSGKKIALKLEKKYLKYDYDNSKYVGIVSGAKNEVVEKQLYAEYSMIDFEGYKFKTVKDYDKYLTKQYGNYMELPPLEKRIANHTFDAYYKEENK